MTPFIITLLLAPVIICNCLASLAARLCVIVIATATFIAVLSGSSRAKTVELVVAGATYVSDSGDHRSMLIWHLSLQVHDSPDCLCFRHKQGFKLADSFSVRGGHWVLCENTEGEFTGELSYRTSGM
jgi:hypothetical protein